MPGNFAVPVVGYLGPQAVDGAGDDLLPDKLLGDIQQVGIPDQVKNRGTVEETVPDGQGDLVRLLADARQPGLESFLVVQA